VEMLRLLGGKDQPTLSDWKAAAATALTIQEVTATVAGARGEGRAQHGHSRYGGSSVNEMSTDQEGDEAVDGDDGHAEGQPSTAINKMGGRPTRGRPREKKSGFRLPQDVYERCFKRGLCLQCFKAGHRMHDDACPEKGQLRRLPAPGELKD
jgi:hypothetical protein